MYMYMYVPYRSPSSQPLGLMQFLESDETVSDEEIDRMHIRDNLKAVTVSCSLALYLRMYILSAWLSCMRTHFPHHTPDHLSTPYRCVGGCSDPLAVQAPPQTTEGPGQSATGHTS